MDISRRFILLSFYDILLISISIIKIRKTIFLQKPKPIYFFKFIILFHQAEAAGYEQKQRDHRAGSQKIQRY